MKEVKLFCPASVANVSCGFDVLGFCFDPIGDEMIIRKTAEKGVRITKIEGEDLPFEVEKNVAGVSSLALLEKYPCDFGFQIEIYKKIKPGSGIGSSAASAAGAVFGINELLGKPFDTNKLIEFAMKGEELASRSLHADNIAPIILGGLTLVRSCKSLDVISLPIPPELYAIIIHPKIEIKTSEARSAIDKMIPLVKATEQWGNLAALVSGFYTNDYDLISRSLVDVVAEPYRAKLIPGFYAIKKAALDVGALGSSISGSGPSIFALSKDQQKAQKVKDAMEKAIIPLGIDFEAYISKISPQGIHIISSK